MVQLHAHGGNIYSDVQCLEHDVLCPHVDLSMRLTDCWGLSCCYTMEHFYILIILRDDAWVISLIAADRYIFPCSDGVSCSGVRLPVLACAIQHLTIFVYQTEWVG